MYARSFGSDSRLKTHGVGSDTRTLTYDAASRITNTTDTNPVNNRTYDYDGLDRLISQSDNSGFKLWGYDAKLRTLPMLFPIVGPEYVIQQSEKSSCYDEMPVSYNSESREVS